MEDMTVVVRIEGRVQGVWFRGWTRSEALQLGLSGWVRNDPDGAVSALLSGPEPRVREMIAEFHRGPEAARVRDVSWQPASPYDGDGFEIRN